MPPSSSNPPSSSISSAHPKAPLVLVTGAGGFLGGEIARQALARGLRVRGLARGAYPQMVALGIEMIQGDLADFEVVSRATKGCEAVFHVAAKAGAWGTYHSYHQTNILGTQHIIDACRAHQVPKLIFTSSPSVVHSGGDIEGGDESLPYPSRYTAHYPRTKAEAERRVLSANNQQLSTVALRPHLIWGPGDNHLTPRIISRADANRLRHLAPQKKVDSVYIQDAATAHLNAYDHLHPQAICAGRAYFISQGEPWAMKDLINGILTASGRAPVHRTLSPKVAYIIGGLLEVIYHLLRIKSEPMMTRFVAEQLSTAHWYDISAARQDLGYQPQHTIQQALERLADHWKMTSQL